MGQFEEGLAKVIGDLTMIVMAFLSAFWWIVAGLGLLIDVVSDGLRRLESL